ncbi:MAG TPA: HD domain-containing protein [Ignavibacteriaceae bacterium]|nr:HD domain-containing protein [Ignavibacteriaceae bacterium]
MEEAVLNKISFKEAKENLFNRMSEFTDPLHFCVTYSLLVEDYIRKIAGEKQFNFALASAGSFSRRELSPYSDIDLMFIIDSLDINEKDIQDLITKFWDNGIEVSHTLRDFGDIQKYLSSDFHTFTQFFETRFLLGSKKIFEDWNNELFNCISEDVSLKIFNDFNEDIEERYKKYGDSAKVLEPNLKMSAGGLRDFQTVEWMYILKIKKSINKDIEVSQAEIFIELLQKDNYTTENECARLLESYKFIIGVRNVLHLLNGQRYDRFEFAFQEKVAQIIDGKRSTLEEFMRHYFQASNVIHRFMKSIFKRFNQEFANALPDSLAFHLDEDFLIKGKTITLNPERELTLPVILKGFYYRGLYTAHFDEGLRSLIVEVVNNLNPSEINLLESSVFFREILKMPKNVAKTLMVMNELGVLSAILPEFKDMIGFFQPGEYHCYTVDEHTLKTIENVEGLEQKNGILTKILKSVKDKEILYLGLLFHDIAKPIAISGHEIIGAEMASSIMSRMDYNEEEIEKVTFLVRNHLIMEQTAFRRNLNDPEILNTFASKFANIEFLDLLYLVTYGDLSAVNPNVWTSWKNDLLDELYRKAKAMIDEKISGEELLISNLYALPKEVSKHSENISEEHVQEHIDFINDISYMYHFTEEEIAEHVETINKGELVSVLFKELSDFTNITVITKDIPALLSKLCGVMSINDMNIHDARIFTRKDGIVIDSFNVTDFRTHKKIESERFDKVKVDLHGVISGFIQLHLEFIKLKSRWKRIESKLFGRGGKVKVVFEKHDRYTIIEIHSPDRLGFLYLVTGKMHELGLEITFAKIATKGDDIVDTFYVLNEKGQKISPNDYEFIRSELSNTISEII